MPVESQLGRDAGTVLDDVFLKSGSNSKRKTPKIYTEEDRIGEDRTVFSEEFDHWK